MSQRDYEVGDTVVCVCCDTRGRVVEISGDDMAIEFPGAPIYRTSRVHPHGIRRSSASYKFDKPVGKDRDD